MVIEARKENGELTIKPIGRLDSVTSGELETKLNHEMSEDITSLTVDMSDVDFVSSKGLRVLVAAYKKLNGKEMVLEGVNRSVKEVLNLSGLLDVFTVHEKA